MRSKDVWPALPVKPSLKAVIRRVAGKGNSKTIFCFGLITAGAQRNGRPLKTTWLRERAEELKNRYPEMPGVAFVQRGNDDTPEFRELIRFCDQLSGEMWPDDHAAVAPDAQSQD
ncbi:hypothetical protein FYK55_02850 [Roseiconus nitratireducens]|uniref:Uncharacterized protein n=1 Tax=Roseiconus nitratireducens TaxID=2605748 RepID=A0A5M6DHX9_9BACT|nr:hypothetical protein [Roseiconus nitratireducens]KAA5545872.1 hypothetical protein FYK55_02850 [Roseiconus nitratireducens]